MERRSLLFECLDTLVPFFWIRASGSSSVWLTASSIKFISIPSLKSIYYSSGVSPVLFLLPQHTCRRMTKAAGMVLTKYHLIHCIELNSTQGRLPTFTS